eukprot:9473967-Pyramimonas_sp.AAC.2
MPPHLNRENVGAPEISSQGLPTYTSCDRCPGPPPEFTCMLADGRTILSFLLVRDSTFGTTLDSTLASSTPYARNSIRILFRLRLVAQSFSITPPPQRPAGAVENEGSAAYYLSFHGFACHSEPKMEVKANCFALKLFDFACVQQDFNGFHDIYA